MSAALLGYACDRQSRAEYGIDHIHPVFVQRSTAMSTHSHTLASHGEILANLPGIELAPESWTGLILGG